MIRGGRLAARRSAGSCTLSALVTLLSLVFLPAGGAGAQSIGLSVSPLYADSVSPGPSINVTATPVPEPFGPSSIQVEMSRDPQFRVVFFTRSTPRLDAQFTLDSLLPEKTRIYFRARLFDRFGTARAETTFSHPVRSWLSLVSPNRATNVLFTRRPTFTWESPAITLPPGPWQYTVTIINTAQNAIEEQRGSLHEQSFVPTKDLDACTSYRWSVTARAENSAASDQVTLASKGTFVIQAKECPSATISYQNFPNPFGRGTPNPKTCFWFDLAHRSTVSLAIYDIRIRPVKRLVPGALPAVLDSGAYGRQSGEQSGCDPVLEWDGTDDRGRPVPPGVYIAVFDADGKRETKKVFYKGP